MGLRTKTKTFLLKALTSKQVVEDFERWENLYGQFDRDEYEQYFISDLPSESGVYHGEIIKWAREIHPKCVLFAGENKKTTRWLKELVHAEKAYTAGLSDTDFKWDFEKTPQDIDANFDLIVTQAILEHLLNPYKHVEDLSNLLQPKGHLIIHTVMPGFPYHRHPIDTVRFFPDWFEEIAERVNLKTVRKRINDTHIFYMYQKT